MTSGSEVPFDAAIFTLIPNEPLQSLSIYSGDTRQAGIYNLKLKYFYVDYKSETMSEREFSVEIVSPCPTAILTID